MFNRALRYRLPLLIRIDQMLTNRVLSLRLGIEALAWVALASLFVYVQFLPLSSPQQTIATFVLLLLGAYLVLAFHYLFSRAAPNPRLNYASLIIGMVILGALDWLLKDYLPNFEMTFILLIVATALVTGWRGTLAMSIVATLIIFAVDLSSMTKAGRPITGEVLNNALIAGVFILTGLVVAFLSEGIRHRILESANAVMRAAELEQQRRKEAERSARRWEILNAVGLKVLQESQPQPLFETIGAELKSLGLNCMIALWDEPGRSLRAEYISLSPALRRFLVRTFNLNVRDIRLRLDDLPLYRQVIAAQRSSFSYTNDQTMFSIWPRISKTLVARIFTLTGGRQRIVAPLLAGGEVIGVFRVWGRNLDETDVPAINGLAQHIAIALEKARVLKREYKRASQLALVNEIGQRVAGMLDSDELLNEVTQLMAQRFGFCTVAVLLNDIPARQVVLRAHAGDAADQVPIGYRQSWDVGLLGAAARTSQTILVNDVRADPRYLSVVPDQDPCRAELVVPLKRATEVLGVLDLQSPTLNAFEPTDVAAMEALAHQIAIALENARLYAQTKGDAEVKAALLRELSHRVKNNLTAIVGLLYLGLDNANTRREEILRETLTRLQSLATTHSLLVDSPEARVDLLELGRRVLTDCIQQLTLPGQEVPFSVQGQPIEISAHQATSIALVLNELVTNALQHAGSESSPYLTLSIERVDSGAAFPEVGNGAARSMARVELYNQGRRLPADFDPERLEAGKGLQLVRALVEKDLQGTFSLSSGANGVQAVIYFTPEKE